MAAPLRKPILAFDTPPGRDFAGLENDALYNDLRSLESAIQDALEAVGNINPYALANLAITDDNGNLVEAVTHIEFDDATVSSPSGGHAIVQPDALIVPAHLVIAFFTGTGGGGPFTFMAQANLANYTKVRIMAKQNTTHTAGAKIRGQYSTDGGSTWLALQNAGTGPEIPSDAMGWHISSFVDLMAGAKADVLLNVYDTDVAADQINSDDTFSCFLEFTNA